MFHIFNKKRKVVVDFFTSHRAIYEVVPVTRATQNYPLWWKDLESTHKIKNIDDALRRTVNDHNRNMKRCWGFTELYKRGFMIRHWCDLMVETDPVKDEFSYVYSYGDSPVSHASHQYNFAFKNYYNMRLTSPWYARDKEGLPFLEMGAFWNNDDLDINICPGIMNYNLSTTTSVNMFFPKKENKYSFTIELGRPLLHIMCLRDDLDIDYKCHLVSEEEIKGLEKKMLLSFGGLYKLDQFLRRRR